VLGSLLLYFQLRRNEIMFLTKLIGAFMLTAHIAVAPFVDITEYEDAQLVRCTCYLPTGNRTADGTWPYEGILASNYDHMGDVALLYSVEGEYIGMFESRDVGGHPMLRNGTAVDIYRDNMDRAWAWVGEWGDHVYVRWIKAEG
jgi:hypothetical protein